MFCYFLTYLQSGAVSAKGIEELLRSLGLFYLDSNIYDSSFPLSLLPTGLAEWCFYIKSKLFIF